MLLPPELFSRFILENRYIIQKPTDKQSRFLIRLEKEAFYGGSAGGGKSSALLAAALMFVDIPGYSAIIFRRTYRDLALPGALMDRANEWLAGTDARWKAEDKTWIFPSGASITFGYLDAPNDKYRYQGAEFQGIFFDELTQIREHDYRYLFSRLRRLKDSYIPLRVRAASNPGGVGHAWVKDRFISSNEPERIFIPAGLADNPHLDQDTYKQSLMALDPVTREQLLNGDWDIEVQGNMFRRHWFDPIPAVHLDAKKVRYWDLAATMDSGDNDPDYTVGLKMGYIDGKYTIEDIRRARLEPAEVERLIKNTAEMDGKKCRVYMEQEPGSAGKALIDHYARRVLHGFRFEGIKTTGSKIVRAQPVSAASEQGQIRILKAGWNTPFFEEIELFPNGVHDDMVDALSGAFNCITPSKVYKLDMEDAKGYGGIR